MDNAQPNAKYKEYLAYSKHGLKTNSLNSLFVTFKGNPRNHRSVIRSFRILNNGEEYLSFM